MANDQFVSHSQKPTFTNSIRSGTSLRDKPFSAAKAMVMASKWLPLSLTDGSGTDFSSMTAKTELRIAGSTP